MGNELTAPWENEERPRKLNMESTKDSREKSYNDTMTRCSAISKPEDDFPKGENVRWVTGWNVLSWLLTHAFFPQQVFNRTLWDPCFCDGSVTPLYKQMGFRRVVHQKENFWEVYPQRLKRPAFILTNPPWVAPWLGPFIDFLIAWGGPFCLILPRITSEQPFFLKLKKKLERLNPSMISTVHTTTKQFTFKNPNGITGTPRRLAILSCFPKSWGWTPPRDVFESQRLDALL